MISDSAAKSQTVNYNGEKPKSQKWKVPACLRMASPVTVKVKLFIPCLQESQQNSAWLCKDKSGSLNEEKDGLILYVYYVFYAGIRLGASSKRLWSLWLKWKESTQGVEPMNWRKPPSCAQDKFGGY